MWNSTTLEVVRDVIVMSVQRQDSLWQFEETEQENECKFNFLYSFPPFFLLNTRQRMRYSNKKAREWMLKNGMDDIWFKAHGKRHDLVYSRTGNYRCLDLWNLFDGICIFDGRPVFFQVKTNAWANSIRLIQWVKTHMMGVYVLSINVKGSERHGWKVMGRIYERSYEGVLERGVK